MEEKVFRRSQELSRPGAQIPFILETSPNADCLSDY